VHRRRRPGADRVDPHRLRVDAGRHHLVLRGLPRRRLGAARGAGGVQGRLARDADVVRARRVPAHRARVLGSDEPGHVVHAQRPVVRRGGGRHGHPRRRHGPLDPRGGRHRARRRGQPGALRRRPPEGRHAADVHVRADGHERPGSVRVQHAAVHGVDVRRGHRRADRRRARGHHDPPVPPARLRHRDRPARDRPCRLARAVPRHALVRRRRGARGQGPEGDRQGQLRRRRDLAHRPGAPARVVLDDRARHAAARGKRREPAGHCRGRRGQLGEADRGPGVRDPQSATSATRPTAAHAPVLRRRRATATLRA
jgi:hypothetical protein